MDIYMAPLEGISGHIFRNALADIMGGPDKYFAPFIDAREKRSLKAKELRDLLPDNNKGITLIPQIMANNASAFIKTAAQLKELGYKEVNINLGCPSGTVANKGRGAGFLKYPQEMFSFFKEIFEGTDIKISVKTRIGVEDIIEMHKLSEVYNAFPFSEIIVHPRLLKEYYEGSVHMDVYKDIVEKNRNRICYNGNIVSVEDYKNILERHNNTSAVMIGRGMLINPKLAAEIKGKAAVSTTELLRFHERLYHDYQENLSGDKTVLFKMKELWTYLYKGFGQAEGNLEKYSRLNKKIKKVSRLSEYEQLINEI